MRKYLFHLALALVLSASFAVAQTTPSSEHPNSVTPQADKDKSPVAGDVVGDKDKDKAMAGAVDDDTIRRQVKEQLATNPAFASVNVDVNGKGHVTLSGDVPTKDDRVQAKNLAEAVPGVRKVKDHMKVNASAVSSTGAMSSTGATSNQAATPSTAGSIAGNTEAATATQQSTTTSSTTAIPQSDVTGSQTTTQQTGQTGAQPSTMTTSSSASTGGQGTQIQQIQQVFQQQNISSVQVVNNNNIIQLVGTVTSQQDKDKAEQLAKQAAPGVTIQNNIQVSQSMSGATSNPSSASSSTSTSNPPSVSSSTSTSTTTTPPAAATQPPMGEASQQSAQVTAQSSTQPSAASTQSSTTTVPQSDVNAQSTTAGQTTSSTSQPNTPFGNIPTSSQTTTSTTTSNTVGQTGGTSDLQTQIEGAIKADTSVSGCNTNVSVTDSQIELTGTCPTGKEKQSIKRTAQSFAGNRRVVDHIRVTGKGSNDTTSPSSTNPSSGTNPPTSSGTTPPSSTEPKPPMF